MLQRAFISIAILLLFNFMEVNAQRVALVLSGGGSRGAAHIGVIKALEEHNIPIDYIAGTSIGAVIGGMYAAGFTVEEMDSLLQTPDFQLWATGEKTEQQHFYYNDQISDPSWIRLRFGISNGTLHYKLPTNIISPLALDYKMVEFFAGPSAAADYNFDSLCIPFRCVSSDIDSNKAYTLTHGDLGKSIRTSMTFPFVFKPISIDGKVLFDGGMYNNFPADVALETWNPDVIIGSQVAGNYGKPDPNDILSQLQNLLMNNTDYSIRIENGILIKPDVKRVQLTDFSMTKAFIDSGYSSTIDLMPTIDSLVHRRTNKQTCDSIRNQFLAKIPELLVDSLEITGVNKSLAHRVEKNILKKSPHQTLDEVKKMYYRISSYSNINYILPEMRFDTSTNHFIMKMEIETKPRFELKVGGNISSNFVNEGFLAVSYNYLGAISNTTSIETYVGQFYSALNLKNSTYFQGRTTFILNSNLHTSRKNYIKNNAFFYDSESPNFLELNDNYFNVNLQTPIKNRAILEGGYYYAENRNKYYQTNSFSKLDTTDQTNFKFSRVYLKFDRNNLNRKQYANCGHQLLITLNGYFGKEHYVPGSTAWPGALPINLYHSWGEASIKLQNYFTIHERFAIGLNAQATISNQPFFNNYTSSLLMAPSYSPTPTSTTYYLPNFRAYNFAACGGQLVFSVIKNLDLRAEAYLFQPYKAIHVEDGYKPVLGETFTNQAFMANTALVWSTFMGPISIGLNYFQDEEDPFMIVFNMGFLLFPPSSR